MTMRLMIVAAALLAASCASTPDIAPGAQYVALGSSFAAGPGQGVLVEGTPSRCSRFSESYPRQLARRLNLTLTDASCGGATTMNVLAPWNELPAQIDAVTAQTRLVTITIGGNDVGYLRTMLATSGCLRAQGEAGVQACPAAAATGDFAEAQRNMERIVAEIRARAPAARVVFVDYQTILPPSVLCEATPLREADAAAIREIERRLAAITADAARNSGSELFTASRLSIGHDACAAEPWIDGAVASTPGAAGYHPNLAGATAVAAALEQMLRR